MAQIYNSDLFKEIAQGARIQTSIDSVPNQIADKVVPVMEVNPKLLRRCNIVKQNTAANATSATVYTTPSDKDFYLCNATFGTIKDATSTSAGSFMSAYIDGVNTTLVSIPGITLTAQSEMITISFPFPLKIDRNTAITINNNTNVANIRCNGSIIGYIDEISRA